MEEYIKLSDVLNILNECRCSDCTNDKPQSCELCQFQDFYNKLMKEPQTIKRSVGKWLDSDPGAWECSVCHYEVERWNNTPYCPICGSRMSGESYYYSFLVPKGDRKE